METVIKPWGSYTVLLDTPRYKIKKLEILPSKRLSLQRHKLREEHWTVAEGSGIYTSINEHKAIRSQGLGTGDYIYVPRNLIHRLEAFTKLVVIEVQIGECLEDDIERLEDDYGRTT